MRNSAGAVRPRTRSADRTRCSRGSSGAIAPMALAVASAMAGLRGGGRAQPPAVITEKEHVVGRCRQGDLVPESEGVRHLRIAAGDQWRVQSRHTYVQKQVRSE